MRRPSGRYRDWRMDYIGISNELLGRDCRLCMVGIGKESKGTYSSTSNLFRIFGYTSLSEGTSCYHMLMRSTCRWNWNGRMHHGCVCQELLCSDFGFSMVGIGKETEGSYGSTGDFLKVLRLASLRQIALDGIDRWSSRGLLSHDQSYCHAEHEEIDLASLLSAVGAWRRACSGHCA